MNWTILALQAAPTIPWRNGGGLTRVLAQSPAGDNWHWRVSVATVDQSGPFSRFAGVDRWFAVLEGDGVQLEVGAMPPSVSPTAIHAASHATLHSGTHSGTHSLTPGSPPLHFDGAASTHCSLLGGSTLDFNLMVRQGRGTSRLVRVQHAHAFSARAGETIAVYAQHAGATLHWGDAEDAGEYAGAKSYAGASVTSDAPVKHNISASDSSGELKLPHTLQLPGNTLAWAVVKQGQTLHIDSSDALWMEMPT